jgi:molybdenum cofactor cytidylyltransferase
MADAEHVARLTRLGLTSYEARAYLALVVSESLTATQTAHESGLPRQRIYDVLGGLVAAGLAVARPGKAVRYEAISPDAVVERLIATRRDALEELARNAQTLATELGPVFDAARSGPPTDCAAVILAAGSATRFGSAKLLARLDGRPLLQHALDLAAEARLQPVVVVLGAEAATLRQACTWRDEIVIVNPDPAAGLSGSVRLGLAQLALTASSRTLLLLADQPRLSVTQLHTLLAAPPDSTRPIVVPRYGGVAGNPVLLERGAWRLATGLAGDQGMSQVFAARPSLVRYIDSEGANPDVDTPADLEQLRASE